MDLPLYDNPAVRRLAILSAKSAHWFVIGYVFLLLTLKGFLEFTVTIDTLNYHIPRALAMFHLTSYEMTDVLLNYMQGYPPLGFFIQGLLVFLTGRTSAANAVGIVGFVIAVAGMYSLHGRSFSWRWFFTFCLAVPLFILHFYVGFNDLFTAFMILLGFAGQHVFYTRPETRKAVALMIVGFSLACLSKQSAWPPVAILSMGSAFVFIKAVKRGKMSPTMAKVLFSVLLLGIAIFPIRNAIVLHNPTYPIPVPIVSRYVKLPGETPEVNSRLWNVPWNLRQSSHAYQFIASVFELSRFQSSIPFRWNSTQGFNENSIHQRIGGWFFGTSIIMLLMLAIGLYRKYIDRLSGTILLVSIAVFACLSHSIELRYSLYFPLCALYLICLSLESYGFYVRWACKILVVACVIYVFRNLPPIWQLDTRLPAEYASEEAKAFWKEHEGSKEVLYVPKGAKAIFYSGPTFTELRVKGQPGKE